MQNGLTIAATTPAGARANGRDTDAPEASGTLGAFGQVLANVRRDTAADAGARETSQRADTSKVAAKASANHDTADSARSGDTFATRPAPADRSTPASEANPSKTSGANASDTTPATPAHATRLVAAVAGAAASAITDAAPVVSNGAQGAEATAGIVPSSPSAPGVSPQRPDLPVAASAVATAAVAGAGRALAGAGHSQTTASPDGTAATNVASDQAKSSPVQAQQQAVPTMPVVAAPVQSSSKKAHQTANADAAIRTGTLSAQPHQAAARTETHVPTQAPAPTEAIDAPEPASTRQGEARPVVSPPAESRAPVPTADTIEPVVSRAGSESALVGSASSTAVAGGSHAVEGNLALHASRPTPTAANFQQIAVHIDKAVAEGLDRITITLKPPMMGRVDVRLDLGHDQRLTAVFLADRPETIDALQRDVRGLERALNDAGLRTDSGGLSFQLRGDGRGSEGFADRMADGAQMNTNDDDAATGDDAMAQAAARYLGADGLLDIRV